MEYRPIDLGYDEYFEVESTDYTLEETTDTDTEQNDFELPF